jgi:hypothetical protein
MAGVNDGLDPGAMDIAEVQIICPELPRNWANCVGTLELLATKPATSCITTRSRAKNVDYANG